MPQDHATHLSDDGIRTLLSWTAVARPYKKKGRQFYVTVILLVLFVVVLLFLFSWYPLMLVVVALVFLAVVLSTVPPHLYHYKISTQGIQIEDNFYIWEELYDFYFKKISGVDVLIVRTQVLYPSELIIPLHAVSRIHVRAILVQFLPFREIVRPTFVEKAAEFLERNFPLEK